MKNTLKLIIAFIASWIVPGLGYLILNKKMKFILLFASIMLLTFAGILIADFRDIRFIDNPYYYIGRFGGGLIWGMLILILKLVPAGITGVQYFDIGHLYICVAGTLNLVIALSVFTQGKRAGTQFVIAPPAPEAAAKPDDEIKQIDTPLTT